jgi:hypothetical protein
VESQAATPPSSDLFAMHEVVDEDERRRQALASLEWFTTRLLRGQLWRSNRCRFRSAPLRQQLLVEVRQELLVDCLTHVDAVLALSPPERHRRWFRFVERWIYHELRRGEPLPEHFEAAMHDPAVEAPRVEVALPREAVTDTEHRAATLRNGRTNVTATAHATGLTRPRVRALWAHIADQLGYDATFLGFWRRRLAEALTGLACDLLRDRDQVRLLPRPRRRPDPQARLRRIRQILAVLAVRPLPHEIRVAIAMAKLRRGTRSVRPIGLLAAAELLAGGCPKIALWRFEAAVADHELATAMRAVVAARDYGADPVAIVLARAKLLAVRGRIGAAGCLLHRARARQPHDPRLDLATRSAGFDQAPSARRSASPSSSSSRTSARGADQDGIEANMAKPR